MSKPSCQTLSKACDLLTYLFGHYKLLQVLASANLRRIRHELLQLGANFRYPAFLDCHPPVWPNAGETVLPPWPRFADFTNCVGAIHTSDMTQPSKTLYFNTLHYVDVIVCIVQLLLLSYAPFSSIAERPINLT